MSLSRRLFFGIGSGMGLCGLLPTQKLAAADTSVSRRKHFEDLSKIFAYGVASGDPLKDRVILWTHVDERGQDHVLVEWEVALDPEFENTVSIGTAYAEPSSDFTVKIDALLPFAGTAYYYRFRAHNYWSPVGRTKTAPEKSENLRLAVVSCSSIWSGYMNAYEMLARRADLDLIVHCGDYAYDVPDPQELRNMPYRAVNRLKPASLHDHRQRYRYYRLDPHLRAAHQQHPWSIIWDNHDVLTDAPQNESIQAFFEWIPIREKPEKDRIYRSLDFGNLLKVILLDTRVAGRNSLIPGTSDLSILGEDQWQWLKSELSQSPAQWNVVVSQVLLSPFEILGKSLNADAWSGYPKDRERFLKFLNDEKILNTIVVSGDAHLSYACNLERDKAPVGIEFLPTSVTRGNLDEQVHQLLSGLIKGAVEGVIKVANPHIRYFETESHGYGIVDLKKAGANCEFWYVDHQEQSLEEHCGRSLFAASGSNRFTNERSQPTLPKSRCDRFAPSEEKLYEKGLEIGGQGGDSFDGLDRLETRSQLRTVRLNASSRVHSLGCTYDDNLSWQKGGSSGSELRLNLETGEYLKTLSVGVSKILGTTKVSYVKVTTNRGRSLEGGSAPQDVMHFSAPSGRHIVSFFGRSDSDLVKLGPIFAPDF